MGIKKTPIGSRTADRLSVELPKARNSNRDDGGG